jgi:glycyl-tRNA synthetase beta chain
MPEFFCELFSEEIPARMQARGAEDLQRLVMEALARLSPANPRGYYGPRRIALALDVAAEVPASRISERGPRVTAPDAALAGFLRKHGAAREDLRQDGDFFVLERATPAKAAAALIAQAMPDLLRRFPWPKSMRWGGTSGFTWVRPLRRICCLLGGEVVKFSLAVEGDDGHGLNASNETEGHRFMAPGGVAVAGVAGWEAALLERRVIAEADRRTRLVVEGVAARAAEAGVRVVEDSGLAAEVAGLVEWPVALRGRIDDRFMDLPPEVMQVSMRVNQRYFATRTQEGAAAPYFVFAANIEAPDGGVAIVAGNERVLRARFADARHFWDLDRATRLADRVAALEGVTFQAGLGSQGDRVRRIVRLVGILAPFVAADAAHAERAALLAKADLTTGMVGEFPELQGVMGGYYARHDGEPHDVADAVRDHYLPKGATDSVPRAPESMAVALADKIDQLVSFFAIGERPTGSGDPYALRRAALGVIRIIRENGLRLRLREIMARVAPRPEVAGEVMEFVAERLRVQMRGEGARHDVLAAVFSAGADDDLTRLLARTEAVAGFLATEDGANLLAAYRRAANILRIEEKKDGPHGGAVDEVALVLPEEHALHAALRRAAAAGEAVAAEDFAGAMEIFAGLRAPVDAFFDKVTVNADEPALRRNRLRLLAGLRGAMAGVADFAAIEG